MIVGLGKLKGRLFNLTFLVTLGNLVLSVILVRPLGIIGVVLGTAIPQLIDLPFNIRYMVRETGTPWRRFFWEVVTPTYPMLIVPLTVSAILGRTGLVSSLPGVAAAIGLSAGAYWLGFVLTGLSQAERHELAGAAQRLRGLVSVRAKNAS
jgi:O-antigen/teichoic acid export membrane protein